MLCSASTTVSGLMRSRETESDLLKVGGMCCAIKIGTERSAGMPASSSRRALGPPVLIPMAIARMRLLEISGNWFDSGGLIMQPLGVDTKVSAVRSYEVSTCKDCIDLVYVSDEVEGELSGGIMKKALKNKGFRVFCMSARCKLILLSQLVMQDARKSKREIPQWVLLWRANSLLGCDSVVELLLCFHAAAHGFEQEVNAIECRLVFAAD